MTTHTPKDLDGRDAALLLRGIQEMIAFAHHGPNGPRVVNADVEAKLPELHDPCPDDTPDDERVYWIDELQRRLLVDDDDNDIESIGLTYTVDLVRGQLVRHVSFALVLNPPHRPTSDRTERFILKMLRVLFGPLAQQMFGPDEGELGYKVKATTYRKDHPWLVYVHFTAPARLHTPMHLLLAGGTPMPMPLED